MMPVLAVLQAAFLKTLSTHLFGSFLRQRLGLLARSRYYHHRSYSWAAISSHSSSHSSLITMRRPIRACRKGGAPATLPLITFDTCPFETRRYAAASLSVNTWACKFVNILVLKSCGPDWQVGPLVVVKVKTCARGLSD